MEEKRLYTARELSRLLKVSQGTIWRWGREGELKTVKVGRLVRFEMPEVKEKKDGTEETQHALR